MLSKEEKRKRIRSFYRHIFIVISISLVLTLAIFMSLISIIMPNSFLVDLLLFLISLITFTCFCFFIAFLSKEKEIDRNIFKEYKNLGRD